MSDVLAQIEALTKAVERCNRIRASIEGQQVAARQQLEAIDAEITQLGFDPETIDSQIDALEAALQQKVDEVSAAVATELQALQAIEQQLAAVKT